MIVGGVSLETVDELRSTAAAAAATTSISDCSLHSLLTDAVTSVVDALRSVYCACYYLQQGGYAFTLFVCLLAGLCKNYLTCFHKIQWKDDTWTKEET